MTPILNVLSSNKWQGCCGFGDSHGYGLGDCDQYPRDYWDSVDFLTGVKFSRNALNMG